MNGSSWMQALCWPLAIVYGGVVRLRNLFYRYGIFRTHRLQGSVISVGNLTVGGTGKTPMVMWLAERFASDGTLPGILTRGYRGRQLDARGLPESDEVALLRERLGARVRIGVGKNRYASGRTLERHGTEWFILDDGFQHLALARDANLVLIDSTDPFGGGRMLPAGRLREPRTSLARADVVVITRSDHAPAVESLVRRYSQAPIFYARTQLDAVLRVPALRVALLEPDLARVNFFAFCGIGNPPAFFDDLVGWGIRLKGWRAFADHHRFTAAETGKLESDALATGAEAMICTEKDVFNLRDAVPQRLPLYACRIRLAVKDPDAFWQAVMDAVQRRRQEVAV